MSHFSERLAGGEFVVTAEIAPPKGVALDLALGQADALPAEVVAVNVTDNQSANMRMAPLALAALLRQRGVEPILQMTCRDRNRMALQADLLAAAALGIENLLLLSGDHPRFGDHPQARPVFDLDSVQLLQAVQALMAGRDLAGRALTSAPVFCPGAAVTPEAEPFDLMFQKVQKKAAAGARFFQTQAVFSEEALARFMEHVRPLGVPVVMGVLLLKNARMARFLNEHIPGVRVPSDLINRLALAEDPLREGVEIARGLVATARRHCQGVHLMTLGCEDRISEILC
ncbi:methylenetetrahydrofolate reductase [Geoalkalibacter halelectricus]|uniref:Methylenetetrahydrofolate reductase n=1 Tax=Geoalkalibacter halelectricus TaxID=2847045 RepID=A0ABY5ZI52_9BACT|nr:methylenetetrahydrofolate reductase [Geoalkalibacter halelectricus]MDO3380163.1 methylenetetrahydrofolate reductase [Geoalkalibacter halelectricus]UWZ78263.1 methylenetetrahydrofolate reductase [Geoalkalibacter halelectricus]